MNLQLVIKVSGVLLILLACAHATFPSLFHWREELRRLSTLNRQMFLVHSFFMAVLLAGFGALNLFYTNELLEQSSLSRAIVAGMACFWLLRLFVQLFVYDPSLWKGNSRRTAAHVGFTLFWVALVSQYTAVLWR